MWRHLKLGNKDSAAEALRVHFQWFADEKEYCHRLLRSSSGPSDRMRPQPACDVGASGPERIAARLAPSSTRMVAARPRQPGEERERLEKEGEHARCRRRWHTLSANEAKLERRLSAGGGGAAFGLLRDAPRDELARRSSSKVALGRPGACLVFADHRVCFLFDAL